MKLTDEQVAAVSKWTQAGETLSDVQKHLEESFGVRITYMDLRFLIDDLDLELKAAGPKFDDPKVGDMNQPAETQPGTVSVSLDKVSRPDALVSGRVTFSDGMSAQWHLDQMGRLSLDAKQPGYKPSPEDLQSFQDELRKAVEKSGMF